MDLAEESLWEDHSYALFTFSELNSRIIGQILEAVSAFSIAAHINIVVRFQPPSFDGIFIFFAKQKLAAEFEASLRFVLTRSNRFQECGTTENVERRLATGTTFLRSSINGVRLAAAIDPILIGTADKEGYWRAH